MSEYIILTTLCFSLMKSYGLGFELFFIIFSLDGDRVQCNFVELDRHEFEGDLAAVSHLKKFILK